MAESGLFVYSVLACSLGVRLLGDRTFECLRRYFCRGWRYSLVAAMLLLPLQLLFRRPPTCQRLQGNRGDYFRAVGEA